MHTAVKLSAERSRIPGRCSQNEKARSPGFRDLTGATMKSSTEWVQIDQTDAAVQTTLHNVSNDIAHNDD